MGDAVHDLCYHLSSPFLFFFSSFCYPLKAQQSQTLNMGVCRREIRAIYLQVTEQGEHEVTIENTNALMAFNKGVFFFKANIEG